MSGWQMILPVAVAATLLIAVVIIIILRSFYNFSKQGTRITEATITTSTATTTQNTGKMEGIRSQRISRTTRPNYNVFRHGYSTKPLFSWADHPSLIADAVENGWSRFAFTNSSSNQVEVTWEVGAGSVDFMQKIRLNSGLKVSSSNSSSMAAKSIVKTALPLPGPQLRHSPAFPQVAYFEISVLCIEDGGRKGEGEKMKLIEEKNCKEKGNLEEFKLGGDRQVVVMSLGLTCSSVSPMKIPGSYHGSIGFNSDGSVNLDGIRLAFGSEKLEWGQEEKVIGCGFDPREKKVFFTVDSELVHVVHCKSDEFGCPLYPVLAANEDITVLVNLGQSRFCYEPTNAIRTPNPCFFGPLITSPAALGYEDSGELFSGRINSGRCNVYGTTYSSTNNSDIFSWHDSSYNNDNDIDNNSTGRSRVNGDGDESEADLFEIVVDDKGKSRNQ